MSDPSGTTPAAPALDTCARCSRALDASDRHVAGDRAFCGSCHAVLREELRQMVAASSTDIPYPAATLGAVLGGAVGALAWWGFTALTRIAFGLIAVGIGFLVGQGAVWFAGGKRSPGMQVMAVVVSIVSFAAGTYLVNRTFINRALAQQGESFRIGLVPPTVDLLVAVLKQGFGIMDVVFLALAVYQAWAITRPFRLPGLETPAA